MNSFIAFLAFCNFCNVIVIFCSGTDNTRESDLKKLHSSKYSSAGQVYHDGPQQQRTEKKYGLVVHSHPDPSHFIGPSISLALARLALKAWSNWFSSELIH